MTTNEVDIVALCVPETPRRLGAIDKESSIETATAAKTKSQTNGCVMVCHIHLCVIVIIVTLVETETSTTAGLSDTLFRPAMITASSVRIQGIFSLDRETVTREHVFPFFIYCTPSLWRREASFDSHLPNNTVHRIAKNATQAIAYKFIQICSLNCAFLYNMKQRYRLLIVSYHVVVVVVYLWPFDNLFCVIQPLSVFHFVSLSSLIIDQKICADRIRVVRSVRKILFLECVSSNKRFLCPLHRTRCIEIVLIVFHCHGFSLSDSSSFLFIFYSHFRRLNFQL